MTKIDNVPITLYEHIEHHETLISKKAETEIIVKCVTDFRDRINKAGQQEKGLAIAKLRTLAADNSKSKTTYGLLLQELLLKT